MAKISQVEPIVRKVLTERPETRGDDYLLIKWVLNEYVNVEYVSIANAFSYHVDLGLPSMHSITRCRRKIQANDENLRSEKAKKKREKEEEEYKDYSRS